MMAQTSMPSGFEGRGRDGAAATADQAAAAHAPAAAPQARPLSQAEAAELRLIKKLNMWALLAHTGGQVAPLLTWTAMPVRARREASACLPACQARRGRACLLATVALLGQAAVRMLRIGRLGSARAHPPLRTPTAQAWDRAQRVGGILLLIAFHLLLSLAPRFFMRRRTQLMAAQRLAYYAFPLLRQPAGGLQVACSPCTGGKFAAHEQGPRRVSWWRCE